jgi:two-component sensor histidine kinase
MQTGLGTSIVEALAKQLLATVEIRPEDPGTRVVIAHAPLTLVKSDAERDGQTPAAKRAAA